MRPRTLPKRVAIGLPVLMGRPDGWVPRVAEMVEECHGRPADAPEH